LVVVLEPGAEEMSSPAYSPEPYLPSVVAALSISLLYLASLEIEALLDLEVSPKLHLKEELKMSSES
jgi:hypothetical protein